MLHLPCLQRDDVIPSSANQYHASRQEMEICNTNHALLYVTMYPPSIHQRGLSVFCRSEQASVTLLCPQPVQQCVSLFNKGNTAKGHLVARQWDDSGLFKSELESKKPFLDTKSVISLTACKTSAATRFLF